MLSNSIKTALEKIQGFSRTHYLESVCTCPSGNAHIKAGYLLVIVTYTANKENLELSRKTILFWNINDK